MTFWITHSGKHIYPDNMSENDICLIDIAHHLTKICRYGGGLPLDVHYSVAQHAIELTKYGYRQGVGIDTLRVLLMHDAAEAYIGDVVSSLKQILPCYKTVEYTVEELILTKYWLYAATPTFSLVKELDTRILIDEAAGLMPHHLYAFQEQLPDLEPLGIDIKPKPPEQVKKMFLGWCNFLEIHDDRQ
tara:strand:+ start:1134 stop:1697 length:564 start_codon:yes stop_codon:yes gene_type:complete